jgi:hypothetical protein
MILGRSAMISFSLARVVVVAGDHIGGSLVHALTRMGLPGVRLVATLEEARQLCAIDSVDACLAVLPPHVPDEAPRWTVETDAPGRKAGVPSLLLVEAVTPYLTKTARSSGYVAAIPANVAPRLLYRWIGALLQKQAQEQARTAAAGRSRSDVPSPDAFHALAYETPAGGKLKLQ